MTGVTTVMICTTTVTMTWVTTVMICTTTVMICTTVTMTRVSPPLSFIRLAPKIMTFKILLRRTGAHAIQRYPVNQHNLTICPA